MAKTEQNYKDQGMEDLRTSRAELAVIKAVQAALASNLDMQGIYEAVGEQLCQIFNSQTIAIYASNPASHLMHLVFGFEKGERLPRIDVPLNSLYQHVIDLGETFILNGTFPEYAADFEDYKVPQGELPKSLLVTPVPQKESSENKVMLALMDIDSGKTFSETDANLLETIANSMSIALENARLLKETEEHNAQLAVINSVQEGLASKLDLPGIYTLVGDTISEVTQAGVVLIARWDGETRTMWAD